MSGLHSKQFWKRRIRHSENLKPLMIFICDFGNNNDVIVKLSRRVRSHYSRLEDSTEDTVQIRCHQDWKYVWATLYLLLLFYTVDLKQKPASKCHCKGLSPLFGDKNIQSVNIIAVYIFITPVHHKGWHSTTHCDLNKMLLLVM